MIRAFEIKPKHRIPRPAGARPGVEEVRENALIARGSGCASPILATDNNVETGPASA